MTANIGGSGGLLKTGTGILTLGGTNNFSGGVTISSGSVIATSNSALGLASGITTIGDSNSGSNQATLQISPGTTAPIVINQLATGGSPLSANLIVSSGSSLAANVSALTTTFNLAGTTPLAIIAGTAGGHTTAQDVTWNVIGSGIGNGSTALILDGTAKALRLTMASTTANSFSGDVVIKGAVTTQNLVTSSSGNTAANQNLTFANNNVTVASGATWSIAPGGETVAALNGRWKHYAQQFLCAEQHRLNPRQRRR